MIIKRYTIEDAQQWDRFVEDSKNGTFLFIRGYMDYHNDRFTDHSLLYFNRKNQLIALLPANEANNEEKELFSHQGLTYGGFILSNKSRAEEVIELFDTTISYLRDKGFSRWHYKQMPTIYHRCPAQEDEYALWRNKALIESCLISSTILLTNQGQTPETERRRKRGMCRALERGYQIFDSDRLELFWPIMEKNLNQKYAVSPVHTMAEMKLLQSRFPNLIRCYLAVKEGTPQAGVIAYLANQETVHIQYGHATETGKKDGALDLMYLTLADRFRRMGYHYMDFGNSNEEGGKVLNTNLIVQKEGFGARGIVYKTYCIDIK